MFSATVEVIQYVRILVPTQFLIDPFAVGHFVIDGNSVNRTLSVVSDFPTYGQGWGCGLRDVHVCSLWRFWKRNARNFLENWQKSRRIRILATTDSIWKHLQLHVILPQKSFISMYILLLHELNELGMAMGVPHSCNSNDNDNICVHFQICKGQNTAASKKFPFEKEAILRMNFLARSFFCYLAIIYWKKCFLKIFLSMCHPYCL